MMNLIPMILEKNDKQECTFDLYSLLLSKRIIFLTGEINDTISSIVVAELLYLDSVNNNNIYLYINSPGGSVTAGMSIYDTMNYVKSKVITIGMGICASMGAFLLSSGNERLILPNAEVMIHEVIGGVQGNATDVKLHAEHILKTKHKVNAILARNTKKSLKQIEKDTSCDNYMSAEEAKAYGIIDKII